MENFNEIKNEKFIFESPVFNNNEISYKIQKGICNLKIGICKDRHIVILTEIPENKGDKITNAFREIANQVYYKFLKTIEPNSIIWIEHYYAGKPQDEYCVPSLKWTDNCYSKINWNFNIFDNINSILNCIK